MRTTVCPVPSTGDEARHIVLSAVDVTLEIGAAAQHSNQRKLLASLTDHSPALVWYIDRDERYRHVNHAFLDWFELSPEEIIGRSILDFMGATAYASVKPYVDHAFAGEASMRDGYLPYRYGAPRFTRGTHVPHFSDDGSVVEIFGVVFDLTAYQGAQDDRVEQERMLRDTTVREMHHRIKNLLQGVVGLVGQLATDPATRPLIAPVMQRIGAIARTHGLQARAGGDAVGFGALIAEVATSAATLGLNANLLQLDVGAAQAYAVRAADAVPIALVISELLSNARKHPRVSELDPVRLEVRAYGPAASLCVISPGGALPLGFDCDSGAQLGTGLMLVKSLMPRGPARVKIATSGEGVSAELVLEFPIVRDSGARALSPEPMRHRERPAAGPILTPRR